MAQYDKEKVTIESRGLATVCVELCPPQQCLPSLITHLNLLENLLKFPCTFPTLGIPIRISKVMFEFCLFTCFVMVSAEVTSVQARFSFGEF